MATAVVTDSTSDIPSHLLEKLGIFQIAAALHMEDRTYRDGDEISREDFYQRLPSLTPLPTTAAPASGEFQELYQRIFQKGYGNILSIHAASNLSGIFNAARLAAEEDNHRVTVVDSRQLSLGLGFQVIAAARDAAASLPVEQILQRLSNLRERIHLFALLDSFTYIHRSGRVSWAKARLGSLLNIKPLVELRDGKVFQRGLARARTRGVRLLEESLQKLGPLEDFAVLHTNAEKDGCSFRQAHQQLISRAPLLVNVTTVIGTHVGPNGLGFAAVVK